ncbi:two-component regulator propeller domain-containing protein [Flavobacterium buctense]|uniref:Two-component regulator propeller domain-containing protein n=1 Tax=Flavobacterium buctense TaxID=1648146 RepID=A0ABU9DZV4_9FLAO|nr:two-component regulator propeller domain-containing protein [Flavobacterium buctense]
MKVNILLLLHFALLLTSCNGQTTVPKKDTDQITKGDTVKALGSSIMVVYQDQKNVYWFGSWETGLYSYDGKTLINYTTKHGLPNNRIDEIKEDQSGNLYFSSCHPKSTIVKFDGTTFTTLSPIADSDWQLQPNDLWFRHAYQTEKVYRYDGTILHELQLPKPAEHQNRFEIYSIYKDRKGYLWFGTNPVGVCRYDGKSFEWITEEDVTEFRDEGANGVRSIAEDQKGDFWFNTEYRYTIDDTAPLKNNTIYTRHKSIGGLDGKKDSHLDEYLSTVRDNQNNLWFVTYRDGVWKYDGTTITHYPVQVNSKNVTVFSIYKDNKGDLWLGTHDNGTFKFDGTSFVKFSL